MGERLIFCHLFPAILFIRIYIYQIREEFFVKEAEFLQKIKKNVFQQIWVSTCWAYG